MTLTRQTFACCTLSPKKYSPALLAHLSYYLCGKPKMNNCYLKKIIVIHINKLFYKIILFGLDSRQGQMI